MPDAALSDMSLRDGASLQIEELSVAYATRTGWLQALDAVSLSIPPGGVLGLVGESGSGKSTVVLALLGLLGPSARVQARRLAFDGHDLLRDAPALRGRRVGVVFQDTAAALNPALTIGTQVTEPMRIHRLGADDAGRTERARQLLQRVGMPEDSLRRYPHEFSGGQRQRIAIARALAVEPEVLICDEVVSALDVSVQATVLNLLLDLQEERGLAYLFISHDLAVVKYMSDEVLVMRDGEVVERGAPEAIYRAPQHEYTRKLLAAIPRGLEGRLAA